MALSAKRQAFVDAYLGEACRNAAKAYCIAYGVEMSHSVYTSASRLLRNVDIRKAIDAPMKVERTRIQAQLQDLVNEMMLIAAARPEDYMTIDAETGECRPKAFQDLPEGASAAIKKVREKRVIKECPDGETMILTDDWSYEFYDKMKAIETIGKHLGGFIDKREVDLKLDQAELINMEPAERKLLIESLRKRTGILN